jgi:hypothetical protein
MNKNFYIILLIIVFTLGLITNHFLCNKNKSNENETVYIRDTTILTRYQRELQKDTVVKWYQKPFYKIQNADTVYLQKIDTVFIDKIKNLDVMIKVDKHKDRLVIKAVNQNGKILKEYIYYDIGRDYTVSSVDSNLTLKTKRFYWSGVSLIVESALSRRNPDLSGQHTNKINFEIGLQSGINYKDKYELYGGIKYNITNKDFFVNAGMKIKIF